MKTTQNKPVHEVDLDDNNIKLVVDVQIKQP